MFFIFLTLFLLPSIVRCAEEENLNQTYAHIQRTHFPQPLTQTRMKQCSFGTECRPIIQCRNQQELKSNPRLVNQNFCGFRHNLPMICCKTAPDPFKPFQRDHHQHHPYTRKKKTKNFEICGTRLKQISLYIVGGSKVLSVTKYPWFASVALIKDSSYLTDSQDDNSPNGVQRLHHYCGSTIISDQYLISSAHCFPISGVDDQDLANYRIGVGDVELAKMQIHEIEQVIIHPNASTENHYNDIALIKLKPNQKLKFSSRIRPICLPFLDFDDIEKNENEKQDQKEDDSNKFNFPDYDERDRNKYGFRNNRYEQSEPFYGFPNPNYRPNFNENYNQRRQNYPYRFADGYIDNFYQFRAKRSNEIKFKQDDLYDELFLRPNNKVTVVGLGDTSFGGTGSDVLKEADLMIVNKYKCNELYVKLKSPSLKKGILNHEFICAADRRLASKLNDGPENMIDRRGSRPNRIRNRERSRRSRRSIGFWINYFTDKLKENRSKKMSKELVNSETIENLKIDNKTSVSLSSDKLVLKTSDKNQNNDTEKDLVNILSEEELREKLAISYSDSCQGDSGGPLIFSLDNDLFNKTMNEHKNNQLIADKLNNIKHNLRKIDQKGLEVSKFYLSGIVSLGRECGNKEYPGVYVSVNYHKNWIMNHVDFDNEKFKL